ncbi:ABC transporter ATP-binding protein [Schaalia sp. ZJ1691]|uniref:ABC transporter ATP-binding protein n=1 Tax=Schaalia sp. ZJ1691 TaxID=2709404 RepID=UPI0013EC86FF|nr:ABC transporter ATP-binding protein [Schaalia sp. ZJ1691]
MNTTPVPQGISTSIPSTSSSPATAASVIRLENVSKVYGSKETAVTALNSVSLTINANEFTAIMGPSGSGKSTMLHMLAGLDTVTSGEVFVEGVAVSTLDDDALTRLRRDRIGFVFQSFNLVPTLTAQANIELPLRLAGRTPDREWVKTIVDVLGLSQRLTHRPSELSGGQQQRVAVARSLASKPAVIVADEPTGNLDSTASEEVLGLLRSAVDTLGQSVIMVTHDMSAALVADRVLVMRDGQIFADLRHPSQAQLLEVAR